MLEIGSEAPDFTLVDANGEKVSLSAHRGKWVVFWWYPEANSSGCSVQAASLDKNLDAITSQNAVVLGASFNTTEQNDQFACDKELHMPLLSDPDQVAGKVYDVIRNPDEPFPTKPRRYTYIIDPDGKIAFSEDANQIPLVQYGDHIADVLTRLQG